MEHVCRWNILFCTDPSRSVAPASECEPSKQTSSQLSCLKASSWPACSLSMSSWHCQLCWKLDASERWSWKLDASCKVVACWRSCWMVSSSWYLVQELGIDWRPSSGSCCCKLIGELEDVSCFDCGASSWLVRGAADCSNLSTGFLSSKAGKAVGIEAEASGDTCDTARSNKACTGGFGFEVIGKGISPPPRWSRTAASNADTHGIVMNACIICVGSAHIDT